MAFLLILFLAWVWLWLVASSRDKPFWGGFWATLPLWGPIAFLIGYGVWDASGLSEVPVELLVATAWLLALVVPSAVGVALTIKHVLTGKTR